jgi:hypothetical protein
MVVQLHNMLMGGKVYLHATLPYLMFANSIGYDSEHLINSKKITNKVERSFNLDELKATLFDKD